MNRIILSIPKTEWVARQNEYHLFCVCLQNYPPAKKYAIKEQEPAGAILRQHPQALSENKVGWANGKTVMKCLFDFNVMR